MAALLLRTRAYRCVQARTAISNLAFEQVLGDWRFSRLDSLAFTSPSARPACTRWTLVSQLPQPQAMLLQRGDHGVDSHSLLHIVECSALRPSSSTSCTRRRSIQLPAAKDAAAAACKAAEKARTERRARRRAGAALQGDGPGSPDSSPSTPLPTPHRPASLDALRAWSSASSCSSCGDSSRPADKWAAAAAEWGAQERQVCSPACPSAAAAAAAAAAAIETAAVFPWAPAPAPAESAVAPAIQRPGVRASRRARKAAAGAGASRHPASPLLLLQLLCGLWLAACVLALCACVAAL